MTRHSALYMNKCSEKFRNFNPFTAYIITSHTKATIFIYVHDLLWQLTTLRLRVRPWKINKYGNVHIMYHWGVFMEPMLQWKGSKYSIFWGCFCGLSHPACKVHVPYYTVIYGLCDSYHILPHLINNTTFRKK